MYYNWRKRFPNLMIKIGFFKNKNSVIQHFMSPGLSCYPFPLTECWLIAYMTFFLVIVSTFFAIPNIL